MYGDAGGRGAAPAGDRSSPPTTTSSPSARACVSRPLACTSSTSRTARPSRPPSTRASSRAPRTRAPVSAKPPLPCSAGVPSSRIADGEDALVAALSEVRALERRACRWAAERRFDASTMVARYLSLPGARRGRAARRPDPRGVLIADATGTFDPRARQRQSAPRRASEGLTRSRSAASCERRTPRTPRASLAGSCGADGCRTTPA